jgi:hypothetical protein
MTRKMTGKRASKRPASELKVSREPGGMSVREAGRLGGLIGGRKGGLAVKAERGSSSTRRSDGSGASACAI